MDSVAGTAAGGPGGIDLVSLTCRLVDIDSTTGREAEAGRWIAQYLRELGLVVSEQTVDDGRFNVIASASSDPPAVVFGRTAGENIAVGKLNRFVLHRTDHPFGQTTLIRP